MTTKCTRTSAMTTATAFASSADVAEIPIWVSGKQLWISGVDRKTTVDEVVETLLGRPDKQYSIAEKWRQVERPLSGDTRILKLWKTWGDAKTEVKLSLKKIQTDDHLGKNTPISSNRKKMRYDSKSTCSKYGQTIHPRGLAQLSKGHGIERLLKLILVQGETIQNQIYKLKDRQFEIEQLECEQHNNRIDSLGTNYLINTYLGLNEDKDSGVTTECAVSSENNGTPPTEIVQKQPHPVHDDEEDDVENNNAYYYHDDDDAADEITIEEDIETEIEELRAKIHLLDKIVKINKKLEKEEETLVRLFINIERCKKDDVSTTADELDLRDDLDRLKSQNERCEMEFDDNRKLLTRVENTLQSRKYYLKRLSDDFYDEMHQRLGSNHHQQPIAMAIANEASISQRVLPYYANAPINKPVLNTLV